MEERAHFISLAAKNPGGVHQGICAACPRQLPQRGRPQDAVPARDFISLADSAPRHLQPWLEGGGYQVSGESPILSRSPARDDDGFTARDDEHSAARGDVWVPTSPEVGLQ